MEILKINTDSVYCVGDLHGNFKDILYFIKTNDIKNSIIIFCGDIGIGFYKPDYYKQIFNKIKKELRKRNLYILFCRGNHDSLDEFNSNNYKDKRIRTLRDYTVTQIFDINDIEYKGTSYNILNVGGAISIDRTYRLARTERRALEYMRHHGCSFEEAFRKCPQEYWLGEEPSFNKDKLDEIKNNGVKINAICTHTCPDFCVPYTKDGIKGWLLEDSKLEKDIDKERQTMTDLYNKLIEDGHPIDKWCYGHYHFHDFQEIDGIKFYLLDMDRNGVMDFVEIYRNDNEINENIIP